jgi:mRNA interferase HigB
MWIISRKAITDFNAANTRKDADSATKQLAAWYHEVKTARWESPQDVKNKYSSASILANDRVVFNICGNKYRLVAWINYKSHKLFIRFIGTHEEYDKINAEEI